MEVSFTYCVYFLEVIFLYLILWLKFKNLF